MAQSQVFVPGNSNQRATRWIQVIYHLILDKEYRYVILGLSNAEEKGSAPLPPQLARPERSVPSLLFLPRFCRPLGPRFAHAFFHPFFFSTNPFRIRTSTARFAKSPVYPHVS